MSNDRTFLEVEDDDQRQNRIGTLLERLNTTSPGASSVSPNTFSDIGHERLPGPVEPPAELLARVQAFLPAISASNAVLSQQRPEDVDIENIREDEERYIEMNLGLGVLEAKPRPGLVSHPINPSSEAESSSDVTTSESESDSESFRSSSDSEDTDSSLSDDDSDESDSESHSGSSIDMKPIVSRPIKPLPRRVSQQANLEV